MRRLAARIFTAMLGIAAVASLAGCASESSGETISPQPQPVLGIDVQEQLITLTDTGSTVQITGAPGTLGTTPGNVTIQDLSRGTSVKGAFDKDGSFDLSLEGEPTDAFRLDALNTKNEAGSSDFTADATGHATLLADQ